VATPARGGDRLRLGGVPGERDARPAADDPLPRRPAQPEPVGGRVRLRGRGAARGGGLMALVVVKVGGSLYDLPDLGGRLGAFLTTIAPDVPVLVPGGGLTTDAIRAFERDQRLGPTASHWLALRACGVNAHFLAHLLNAPVIADPREAKSLSVLDPFAF